MTITVTKNEYNTLFVKVCGVDVADSSTFRRRRGFWNKATQTHVAAPDFTPRKVKAAPSMVLAYLEMTGTTEIPEDAEIRIDY